MDPTRRFRDGQAKRGHRQFAYWQVRGAVTGCLGGVAIFTGITLSILADARVVYRTWPYRNTVRGEAEIISHKFDRKIDGRIGGDHHLAYRFEANGQTMLGNCVAFSDVADSVATQRWIYRVEPGDIVPVYYDPNTPEQNILFLNFTPQFKESATRLGWVSLTLLLLVLVVVLVVVFYRPKKTERLFLPEKIELPPDLELKS
jgi:hypothetical protein